jgi:hypothetical protein
MWIVDSKSERQIIPLFNMYHTDRELRRERYFKREFNINGNIQTEAFKIAHHMSNIFKILLARGILTLKIIQPRDISNEASKLMWPYTMTADFNSLPHYIRGNVISSKCKELLDSYLSDNHKHLKQSLKCEDYFDGKPNRLPYNVINLQRNILDTDTMAHIKDKASINTNLMNDSFSSKIISNTAKEIWEKETLNYVEEPVVLLEKLAAICITLGASEFIHAPD